MNEDLLDKFVIRKNEAFKEGQVFYKLIDFGAQNGGFVKIQRIFDQHGVLLETKKSQNIETVPISDFFSVYMFLEKQD